jgi:hypothetical protein
MRANWQKFFIVMWSANLVSGLAFVTSSYATANPSSAAPAVQSSVEVITKSMAHVGGHVITSREVAISRLVQEGMESGLVGKKTVEEQSKDVNATLTEWVLFLEAESFAVGKPTDVMIKAEAQKVLQSVGTKSDWKKLEVSSAELRETINRKLTAQNLLRFKTEFSGVKVTDDEAKLYFEKNRAKFGNVPFATFQDSIKNYLTQQNMEDKMKDWFTVLKRKYKVRVMESQ